MACYRFKNYSNSRRIRYSFGGRIAFQQDGLPPRFTVAFRQIFGQPVSNNGLEEEVLWSGRPGQILLGFLPVRTFEEESIRNQAGVSRIFTFKNKQLFENYSIMKLLIIS